MRSFTGWIVLTAFLAAAPAGCNSKTGEKNGAANTAATPSAGESSTTPAATANGQSGETPELPPNHPPIGNATTEGSNGGPLVFTAPEGWETVPPRNPMIQEAYLLPAPKEGEEEAVLEITYFPGMKNIPFSAQVARWSGQFTQPESQPADSSTKETVVEGGKHPIHLLDIRGTYHKSSMMGGAPAEPKENYRMLAAQIDGPTGPSFVKLIGPNDTVTHWKDAFMKFLKTAQ